MTKDRRKRLAAIRAIAPLTVVPQPVSDHQHQPVDEIEEPGDANSPENLPQVSRASHYS